MWVGSVLLTIRLRLQIMTELTHHDLVKKKKNELFDL